MSNLLMLGVGGATASTTGGAGFGALARKSVDQTAADYSGGAVIAWDGTDVYDTNDFHDPSSNNSKIIIPAALNGYYAVLTAMVEVTSIATTTEITLRIRKGGTATFNGASALIANTGSGVDNVSTKSWMQCSTPPIQLTTGDEFEAFLDTSTADTSITIEAENSSFGIRILGSSIAGALVRKASDLTATNFTGQVVTWDTEIYDTDAIHDTGSNTSRFTVPVALNGKYGVFKANFSLSSVSTGSGVFAQIFKNGAAFQETGTRTLQNQTAVVGYIEVQSQPVLLTTGDYYEASLGCSDTSTTLVAAESSFSLEVINTLQGALCKKAADQTTANYSTPTAMAFDGVDIYDTDAAHDPSSNNTKIIIPSAWNGKYGILCANVDASSFTGNQNASIAIEKAGAAGYDGFGGSGGHNSGYTNALRECITQPILLATGDEFTAKFWSQDTSVTIETERTTFGIRIVGP